MTDNCQTSAAQENVVIQAGACSLTLLPHLGGKISSLRVNDLELLQAPLAPLAPRTSNLTFDRSDASGWDECLPSVAACTIAAEAGTVDIPDHGDLWRVAWEPISASTLRAECFSLPLTLERSIMLDHTAGGWQLRLSYKLTNGGKHRVPWAWSAHPLFAVDPGDTIVLPRSVTSLRVEGSARNQLGKANDTISWPVATLNGALRTDLSVAQSSHSGIGSKLFAGPLSRDDNWCELHRPRAGLRLRVGFNATITPYLGLWLCYGGWPDRPGPKQNCVALEPSTAPVDSLAESGQWSRTLEGGQSASWTVSLDIEII